MSAALIRELASLPGMASIEAGATVHGTEQQRCTSIRFSLARSAQAWASLELLSGVCSALCFGGDQLSVTPRTKAPDLDLDSDCFCFELTCSWRASNAQSPLERLARALSLAMEQPWYCAA